MIAIISDPSTNKYRQMRLRLAGAARARWPQRGSAGGGRYKDEKTKEERKHKEVMTQQKELQRVQEEDLARKSKLLDEVHALQERNKNLVARRYELAYNIKAPDADLIEFFASWMEESPRSAQVPGRGSSRSPVPPGGHITGDGQGTGELSSGVRAYLERRRVLIRAFPDLQFTMLEQTTQGGSVYTVEQIASERE